MINSAYFFITTQLLCYVGFTARLLFVNREIYAVDNIRWRWGKGVIFGILIISISFTLQLLVYDPVLYLSNIGLSVAVLYLLSLLALRQNKLFVEPSRKSADSAPEIYAQIGEKVKRLMDTEAFVDSDLSLSKLAGNLNVQPYVLSRAIIPTINVK